MSGASSSSNSVETGIGADQRAHHGVVSVLQRRAYGASGRRIVGRISRGPSDEAVIARTAQRAGQVPIRLGGLRQRRALNLQRAPNS
jgi:hypothetical protein